MKVCLGHMNMRPADFWNLTFMEYWAMWNAKFGKAAKPLTRDELEDFMASVPD